MNASVKYQPVKQLERLAVQGGRAWLYRGFIVRSARVMRGARAGKRLYSAVFADPRASGFYALRSLRQTVQMIDAYRGGGF